MFICALIPIKHNSERVPGKNFKLFNGKPLFYWIIKTILSVSEINQIVIDTDSTIIKTKFLEYFQTHIDTKKIIIYNRPESLCGGHVATNKLFMNVIKDLNLTADIFFQTHTTNPLLKPNTIKEAITIFIKNNCNSLFSVKKHQTRFYDKDGKDINHNRFILIPTQELDPIYEENSCIYLFTKKSLFQNKARISKDAYLFEMSDIESTDIDWPEDFTTAEIIHKGLLV